MNHHQLTLETRLINTRQTFMIEEMKAMMLEQNEKKIKNDILSAERERTGIDESLHELSLTANTPRENTEQQQPPQSLLDEESKKAKQELIHELQHQKALIESFRQFCEEALSKAVYQRTGAKIKGVTVKRGWTGYQWVLRSGRQAARH
ncbi:hypothetical protein P171DRAFT_484108 [Karstenula rhodostoma CBS 690.94]|uniref:Uncharacterized protein n=1 Tax=Karstenula rhodostoma CBS 690.94 TaxID=1392251 RepID=A0A9P4PM49_9PLEO|nr:hypothetical protein P171DRAFT_484108 [Karstenula rhodostoma CBS 690.94]